MKGSFFNKYGFLLFMVLMSQNIWSQTGEATSKIRLGVLFGQAAQARFPLTNTDYRYETHYVKLQLGYTFYRKKRFAFEFLCEPSLYRAEHQLLNPFFIQPGRGPDFMEQRERFTQERRFNEYVLNLGVLVHYRILQNLGTYVLGSVGPLFSTDDTERLRRGFAFSDILGWGLSYRFHKVTWDFRATLRHTSNANLFFPNNGHNSVGLETGFTVDL